MVFSGYTGGLKPSRVILIIMMEIYNPLSRIVLFLLLLYVPHGMYAADSDSYTAHQRIRGAKVARFLCRSDALRALDLNASDAVLHTRLKTACPDLDNEEYPALLAYLRHQMAASNPLPSVRPVPKSARCPVCGMVSNLYPAWTTLMVMQNGKKFYFDGIKDLMRFYLDEARYRYDRREIARLVVQDFYGLAPLDARKAWYVVDSDIRGPMGRELVPLRTRKQAETFLRDHHGRSIVRFEAITPRLLSTLDGSGGGRP